ncbi:MAG: LysE family translocator [Hyphomicrobiaceae bacterium]
MASDILIAFVSFAAVTLFTPGPNNMMLMTSGLNFGFRRTLPHLLGVALGFSLMVLLVGVGIGAALTSYPRVYAAMQWGGVAYLLYLAWAIATSGPPTRDGEGRGQPMTFLGAAAFQWINPKGWVMAVGAVTTFASLAAFPLNIATMCAVFGVLGLASSGVWVLFGQALRRLLSNPRTVRIFNVAMALALVATLWPIAASLWP